MRVEISRLGGVMYVDLAEGSFDRDLSFTGG